MADEKKETSWENLNGISENEKTCGLNDMNCLGDSEDMTCGLNDMNCLSGEEDMTCSLSDMNCTEDEK